MSVAADLHELPGRAADSSARAGAGMRRPARIMRHLAVGSGLCVLLVLGYLAGGFLRFTHEVSLFSKPPAVAKADGIVVLTGGALRLDKAFDLLKEGHADRLLISGVNPGTSVETLARLTATNRSWFDCCVDIDYAALNTIGNAEMTSRWARMRGFDELILVTSDYHMPRSLMEFEQILELRSVVPYAVPRADLWGFEEMPTGKGVRVLLTEYLKLVAARLRLATGLGEQPAVSAHYAGLGAP